jgi:hypothetical protein
MKRTVLVLSIALLVTTSLAARRDLPARLSDTDFWSLIDRSSEPDGFFRSDNLVSDEAIFAQVVPDLLSRPRDGGVYLGVGPEQNFTYIAALESPMAFVLDIRRGNLHLQLLYKALFELSADRAEFISRLFVKPRQPGLTPASSAEDLIRSIWSVRSSGQDVYNQHLADVRNVLVTKHGLPLSQDDLDGIANVYHFFYWYGPSITWASSSGAANGGGLPNFAALVVQSDAAGRELSFLATESRFSFVKNLQAKNLIVPIVGNFAGPKALRAIGAYVRDRNARVGAFYVSEVEAYLVQDGVWPSFCGNLATLPVDARSVLIRPSLFAFIAPPLPGFPPSLVDAFSRKTARLVPIGPEVAGCRR